ncbi:MAG TPA: nitronate monooxygenase family protein [Flavobacteriales bacterium]|nr:nitronate monooxygenase family protein [Flavobacteriales bacterium]MCC6654252.1 nitronate monooxygenase [Flavobacteriales bacterium]HMU12850.1 nitronate monooxygenase family protein [Flavobacteriales bacterium]HMW95859.1 nitronate monooxygenase family protein [Flavobacteriales bacterium]HMZ48933.1 nitronate monooxygenase family protein [Flavobacteriales bacterium]
MTTLDLTSRLTLPVVAAPMFIISGTELVIECCKNGIVGTFPALNGRTSEDFERMLARITGELERHEQTTGRKAAPFGVNIIVHPTNPRIMADLQLCAKYKVPLIITSLGAVKELVSAVHDHGGLVFHDIVKKRHAEKAAEAGVDGLILVAAGAGGHAGTASPFALVAEIRSFYTGIILLAGGINSGSDILAARTMGADLAYMGTRFIATRECLASDDYKQMILSSGIDDIIYTDGVSGVKANFIKQSLERAGIDLSQKKDEDFSKLSGSHAKAWKDIWSAGHGSAGITDVPTVAELVMRLGIEYKAALERNDRIRNELAF